MLGVEGAKLHLAGEQALQKGLPLVAGAVLQVFQSYNRPVCEGVQVLGKAALYDACTNRGRLSAPLQSLLSWLSGLEQLVSAATHHQGSFPNPRPGWCAPTYCMTSPQP